MERHNEWVIDPEACSLLEAPDRSRRVSYLVSEKNCGAKAMSAGLFWLVPGQKSIPDLHPKSEEIYYVVRGKGELTLDGECYRVSAGMVIYIPAGVTHQSSNTGDEDLCYFFAFSPPPTEVGVQPDFREIRKGQDNG